MQLPSWLALVAPIFVLAGVTACQAPARSIEESPDHASIRSSLSDLYTAFCFDPGEQADWEAQRSLFAEGATFVAPFAPGTTPRAVDTEQFLADFQQFIRTSPLGESGYHERITDLDIESFGGIAHAFVSFEGFVPGEPADRRGIDSIQLVRDGDAWLVASFTTQYE